MSEIITVIIITLIIWAVIIYNRMIRDRNRVFAGWSDIDVQLKLRHNLIPNLVSATQQYAKYEQAVLHTITELRTQSEQVDRIDKKGSIEDELGSGLHKLIALVEQYPDLKANENFKNLQDELVDIEAHIQYARRYYNGAVRNYNTCIERFPNIMVANLFNFKQSEFFQLESEDMQKSVRIS